MSLRDRIGRLAQARPPAHPEDVQRLRERLQHLEALVEGLQDAVHRDAVRTDERIADLEHRLQPDVLAKALSEDARRRGL